MPEEPKRTSIPEGKDVVAAVTRRIVAELAAGTPSWVRPWSTIPRLGLPHNALTRRTYGVFNSLLLWQAAAARGCRQHGWLTALQIERCGWRIRAGAVPAYGVMCFRTYTALPSPTNSREPARGELAARERGDGGGAAVRRSGGGSPALKAFEVYNVEQVDGLPDRLGHSVPPVPVTPTHPAAQTLEALGAAVRHGGSRAGYAPGPDVIILPLPGSFDSLQAYFATSLHEHVHWTGHPTRLRRHLSTKKEDPAYAFEELVAEFGAAYLCASLRIDGRLQHASYIASWMKRLVKDPTLLHRATTEAEKAMRFVLAGSKAPGARDRSLDTRQRRRSRKVPARVKALQASRHVRATGGRPWA